MTRVYYKEAVGALISFDVSRPETLQHTIQWKEDLGSLMKDRTLNSIQTRLNLIFKFQIER